MKILPAQAQQLKRLLKSLPDKRKARGLRHRQITILGFQGYCQLIGSEVVSPP